MCVHNYAQINTEYIKSIILLTIITKYCITDYPSADVTAPGVAGSMKPVTGSTQDRLDQAVSPQRDTLSFCVCC